MDKIPCSQCGALILSTTAEKTGGACMACKQGIREDIEASRAFYARQKEHDPFRELWVSLVKRSSDDPGLDTFSDAEKLYFATSLLEGEVYNGGLDQYFSNSSGEHYRFAVQGLEAMSAVHSLALLQKAAALLFGKQDPPASQAERWRIMYSPSRRFLSAVTGRSQQARLEALDSQFYEDRDGLIDRLTAYATEQGLVQPFEKGSA